MSDEPELLDTCRYAAGLPHRDRRPLAPHDASFIAQRLRRTWIETLVAATGVGLVLAGSLLAAPHLPALARPLGGGLGLGLVALGAAGLLVCLTARGWWRWLAIGLGGVLLGAVAADLWLPALAQPRWLTAEVLLGATLLGMLRLGTSLARRVAVLRQTGRIRLDLQDAVVDRYEGPAPLGSIDPRLARWRDLGEPGTRAKWRLELLPRSGLVVRLGGRRVPRWVRAHVADVAPVQPYALRVALPRGVAPAEPDPRMCLRRRSLTPQERAELERHIAGLRRRWWPAAALTVVVLAIVTWNVRRIADEGMWLDGASLGWLALLVAVYVAYGRRVLAARRLEHDRRLRWVVTVHQDSADPTMDPPSLEVLPISRLAWTERATPAGWRLSRL